MNPKSQTFSLAGNLQENIPTRLIATLNQVIKIIHMFPGIKESDSQRLLLRKKTNEKF